MRDPLRQFRNVWLVDFEFHQPVGERPEVICIVAREFRTGRTLRHWLDELGEMSAPPFSCGEDTLFVAYYASAELGCFLSLGWQLPVRVLDLFTEFRCLTNGISTVAGAGLLGALAHYGLGAIDSAEKSDMRELAQRGAPFTARERNALLEYCETDVVALAKLLPAMLPMIDLTRALLRGRYMAAAARMEANGIPVDVESLRLLRLHFVDIKKELIQSVDVDFGVYVPTGRRVDPQTKLGAAIYERAARIGVDPFVIGKVLGHTDPRGVTAIYDVATYDHQKRAALTALERRLEQILRPVVGTEPWPA